MGKFDGILICTDLDGTLLKNDKSISKENIQAAEYFKSEGGYFTFVTGRMPGYVSETYNTINPNAPFGCVNGGGLYDHREKKYIWKCIMPDGVVDLIRLIDKKYDDVGIQVCTFDKTYFCKENQTTKRFRAATGLPNVVGKYYEIDEPIGKIIFGSDYDEEIFEIDKALRSHPLADRFDFIRSEKTLFEILPKGICKGTSILKLSEYLGIDMRKTIAIGDYDNDVSMLRTAKTGIAVKNACGAAKNAADYITVSNEEHAIAKVIYDLESGKYPI